MNEPLTPCPGCGQTYALNGPHTLAMPGHRSEPQTVRVPAEDVYGVRTGTRTTTTSHWVSQGPPVAVSRDAWVWSWPCACGVVVEFREPATVVVPCVHGAPKGGACRVRALQLDPPSDLYTNPRHGAACECCGHQGTHTVRVDGEGYRPRCLQE